MAKELLNRGVVKRSFITIEDTFEYICIHVQCTSDFLIHKTECLEKRGVIIPLNCAFATNPLAKGTIRRVRKIYKYTYKHV